MEVKFRRAPPFAAGAGSCRKPTGRFAERDMLRSADSMDLVRLPTRLRGSKP